MINTIYERNINKATSVIVVTRYKKFEVCIMDYNAICCRPAMLITEGVLLWDYAPTFEDAKEAIAYVKKHISDFI